MPADFDAALRFLLKYPLTDFTRGELTLRPVMPPWLLLLALVAAAVAVTLLARRLSGVRRRDRWILVGLRVAALALLGLCLLRPTLVLHRAIPERNVLAIVYDDSRSMDLPDHEQDTRREAVQRTFADSGALLGALRREFALRAFRFGNGSAAVSGVAELAADGGRSDLAAGLAAARETLSDGPLAGIVLVSDGAHNGRTDLATEVSRLAAAGIPVYTVGVGTSHFAVDVGIDALSLPDEVLSGSVVPVEVTLRVRGVAGRRLRLESRLGARLVSVDTVRVPRDRELMRVPIDVPVQDSGDVVVETTVVPLGDELTTANNRARAVLSVRPGPDKILYIEGEPRSELAFLRRAVADDRAVQLVTLVRTGEGKLLRLGVDDSLELRNGVPVRAADLFEYRGIVLGSVESSFFEPGVQRLLQDFVAVRGGGLLALGGRDALAEGGYAGTPIGQLLPLALPAAARGSGETQPAIRVWVRPVGETWQPLSGRSEARISDWDSLADLTIVNRVGPATDGAVFRLEGVENDGTVMPILVTQRFGQGHSGIFLPQDAWRWQMAAALPEDDRSLEVFWRQMMRWVVTGVPDRVRFGVTAPVAAPGEERELRVAVVDSAWQPRDDASVTVRVTPPDAEPFLVPLSSDVTAAGAFVGQLTPQSEGIWRLEAVAVVGTDSVRRSRLLVVSRDAQDPGNMERNDATLRRIAAETGGRQYDIDDLDDLPRDAAITRSGLTARVANDLWDAPVIFLAIVTLLACEWYWRRAWGLG